MSLRRALTFTLFGFTAGFVAGAQMVDPDHREYELPMLTNVSPRLLLLICILNSRDLPALAKWLGPVLPLITAGAGAGLGLAAALTLPPQIPNVELEQAFTIANSL